MIFYWLIIAILAYFFFSLGYLGDKLVLAGPPKPKSYTFYAGLINLAVLLLLPFAKFPLLSVSSIIWIIAEALVFILGLYVMFSAMEKFDVSRVMATIGATQPIFILILTWIFWGYQMMSGADILAFLLLIIGGIIISAEKNLKKTEGYLKITLLASLLFSFEYIFSKMVYLQQPFLQGLILMRVCIALFALLLLLPKNNRKEIFNKKIVQNKKTEAFFVFAQFSGGVANFLQAFAVSLAPIAFLPIVNSLRGVQYVFLFFITLFLSVFFPKILKEEISRKVIFRKIISIILILTGLAILIAM
jgi:drug/metabolite transporter (DMT)-like permease